MRDKKGGKEVSVHASQEEKADNKA